MHSETGAQYASFIVVVVHPFRSEFIKIILCQEEGLLQVLYNKFSGIIKLVTLVVLHSIIVINTEPHLCSYTLLEGFNCKFQLDFYLKPALYKYSLYSVEKGQRLRCK